MASDPDLDELWLDVEWAGNAIPGRAVDLAPDVEALGVLLANLRWAQARLKDASQYVEDELVKAMTAKEMEVQGVGVIIKHSGSSRKGWDKDGLTSAVIHAVAIDMPYLRKVDPDTGETEPVDEVKLVTDIILAYQECATPNWKVTGLRTNGIDPSEYCETTWGRKTVSFATHIERPVI